MMKILRFLFYLLIPVFLTNCVEKTGNEFSKLSAIPFDKVQVNDYFWSPRIQTIQDTTIFDLLKILEDQGKIDNLRIKHYAHFNDLMATFVEIAGAEYPQIYKGNQITPMEGVSLFETLKGNVDTERILTFEHSGHPAIRKGDWKLVSWQNNSLTRNGFSDEADFELYNILEDRSETNNLASDYPEKAKQLKDLMEQEFHRTQVFPRR